ncbi:hypothetical protein [Nonomuraea rhizosphaerae]|uniref:hypothetical protein n=1 Tax=Nonomuraea rhizosphaerae TaxID=2665663 RepID=UPI001C5D57FA|nr:hypothetical protein [Nonomuraea rhizosphaerae]
MPLRLLVLLAGLSVVVAGCGTANVATVLPPEESASTPASAHTVDANAAGGTFQLLGDLDQAWKRRDCAAVAELTTWAEKTLGGRACEATRNDRPALYSDPVFFLPPEGGWFAALARKPSPAYFLFLEEGDRWRLAAGPIAARGRVPEPSTATTDPAVAAQARVVAQSHLTYLTDPAGVAGVRFASGDPVRGLRDELNGLPAKVRPDRLDVDVERLEQPTMALPLSSDSMLVFDGLRLVYRQRPKAGRTSLAHPLGRDAEIVVLASVVSAENGVTTVGVRRGPA